MLFNSYEFIFAFLPIVVAGYWSLRHRGLEGPAKMWVVGASLFFYSFWNPIYLPLIVLSVVINFFLGTRLSRMEGEASKRKRLLAFGVTLNLGAIAYFKYVDFILQNVNGLFGTEIPYPSPALPLAISFFTFQQVAFLVDCYRHEVKETGFLNYTLFVTFFPQLIAGPIVHHKQVMPQFRDPANARLSPDLFSRGVFIFAVGLFKKVILADTFAAWANVGFDQSVALPLVEAWVTSLSYTFQLYFDFSGYSDMAIGGAYLFNIKLPMNFNSPYKALSEQDFWRRWHMSLSRFLRDYIYIPCGGNRGGKTMMYRNLVITFLLGGIWHGAGWTFIAWGLAHGIALVATDIFRTRGGTMPRWLAWFLQFQFSNISWVFFRAKRWSDVIKVLSGMAGLTGVTLPRALGRVAALQGLGISFGHFLTDVRGSVWVFPWLAVGLFISVALPNSVERTERLVVSPRWAAFTVSAAMISILYLGRIREFLYFNF